MEILQSFGRFGLSDDMLQALTAKGFKEPTGIQRKVIPLLMKKDCDLVCQAQTGTGKTAAFGIPIIESLEESADEIQVLILTPTRELAIQVSEELRSFIGQKRLRVATVYGGQPMEGQIKVLKRGVNIVVGTPGRVLDMIKRRILHLDHISYLVLDEADEMLNMGFLEDVTAIIKATNPARNTLLFSATMPRGVVEIARRYMHNYEQVKETKRALTVDLTDQIYFEVSNEDKLEALCRIIDMSDDFYGLVFCRTRAEASNIANRLAERGYFAEALHGEISQSKREAILKKFKTQRLRILAATDVAARGIDIQNLTHVINFTIPQDPNAYVHRIGRTGRAGREGTAITFVTPNEHGKLSFIKRITQTEIRREKVPNVKALMRVKREQIRNDILEIAEQDIDLQFLSLASEILRDADSIQALAAALKYAFEDRLNESKYRKLKTVKPKNRSKPLRKFPRGKKFRHAR